MAVRLDRMEGALRQLTGTIEQLQYRNQQLELQLKRMQDDTEYRFQQMGGKGGSTPPPSQGAPKGPYGTQYGRPVWHPAARRLPLRLVAVPTCSIRRKIRLRRARRAPWETRRQSRRPNRGRTMGHRSGPRVAAPPARRSIYRPLPETIPHPRKPAHHRQWHRRRRPSRPRLQHRCRHRKTCPVTATTSAQCHAGWPPARDASAFGHAARRVRHGLWLRPA